MEALQEKDPVGGSFFLFWAFFFNSLATGYSPALMSPAPTFPMMRAVPAYRWNRRRLPPNPNSLVPRKDALHPNLPSFPAPTFNLKASLKGLYGGPSGTDCFLPATWTPAIAPARNQTSPPPGSRQRRFWPHAPGAPSQVGPGTPGGSSRSRDTCSRPW